MIFEIVFLAIFMFLSLILAAIVLIEVFRDKKTKEEIEHYTKWYNKRDRIRRIAFIYGRTGSIR